MTEEAKRCVEALRWSHYHDDCTDENDTCPVKDECFRCDSVLCNVRIAADLIESLSAQLGQTENKLSELLSYVTGGRFSKTDYSIDDMRRFVDDYNQSECNECDQLEYVNNERDRLNIMLSEAQAMLETRTKERDAAVEMLRESAWCCDCTYYEISIEAEPCKTCHASSSSRKPNWQWRGVREESE